MRWILASSGSWLNSHLFALLIWVAGHVADRGIDEIMPGVSSGNAHCLWRALLVFLVNRPPVSLAECLRQCGVIRFRPGVMMPASQGYSDQSGASGSFGNAVALNSSRFHIASELSEQHWAADLSFWSANGYDPCELHYWLCSSAHIPIRISQPR